MEGIDSAYISKCLFHPEKSPLCPIFKLGDIVKLSGFNFETIASEVSHRLWILATPQHTRHTHWTHSQTPISSKHTCTWLTLFWCFDPFVLSWSFFFLRVIASCTVLPLFCQGGAIGIVVDWTCNFDLDVRHCKPQYNFHGLYGNPSETDSARTSVGYNFRCVTMFH